MVHGILKESGFLSQKGECATFSIMGPEDMSEKHDSR